jgi:hypothetical protein
MRILIPPGGADNPPRPRAWLPWAVSLAAAVVSALAEDLDHGEVADILALAAAQAAAARDEQAS